MQIKRQRERYVNIKKYEDINKMKDRYLNRKKIKKISKE